MANLNVAHIGLLSIQAPAWRATPVAKGVGQHLTVDEENQKQD